VVGSAELVVVAAGGFVEEYTMPLSGCNRKPTHPSKNQKNARLSWQ
jgi:hypothetical protein